ncbi:GNAT family N-acetyltransferase [Alteribacter lacisalsi]|uniref:GNAT family N-acetyltransferase n=1 Tax=Alteribacter lacisalsi TaxID=2045244 RepID=UPI001F3477D6|nr:GNAT family N-acetyltransferase [Alteribacter lacisalsi]
MTIPFADEKEAKEYEPFMQEFVERVYGGQEALFFERTTVVCDEQDEIVATCTVWDAYGKFTSIHWFKVLETYEGIGIGRALLSKLMKELEPADYPVYLHTQPGSYRAIWLYSDFGFDLLAGERFGTRTNDLEVCLPILKKHMPDVYFSRLGLSEAPEEFTDILRSVTTEEF